MPDFTPESFHSPLLDHAPRVLRFNPHTSFPQWQSDVRAAFLNLLGPMPPRLDLNLQIESESDHPTHHEIRYLFTAEPGAQVPCHLLIPKSAPQPLPLVICLQGHNTGMHLSLARPKFPGDDTLLKTERHFALQAVRQGYAALALEQRARGERADQRPHDTRYITNTHPCHHATMLALHLGRTLMGQRVYDVIRAIDSLAHFPQIDLTRIACMGNSGGGTVSYYAAACDPRIAAVMPACSVCTYHDSIGTVDHCMCNYLPNLAHYFEMADIAGAIAPRPLLVVAGEHDHHFPIHGVKKAMADIEAIYRAAAQHARNPALQNNCRLVVGHEGHRFYPDESWPVFRQLTNW